MTVQDRSNYGHRYFKTVSSSNENFYIRGTQYYAFPADTWMIYTQYDPTSETFGYTETDAVSMINSGSLSSQQISSMNSQINDSYYNRYYISTKVGSDDSSGDGLWDVHSENYFGQMGNDGQGQYPDTGIVDSFHNYVSNTTKIEEYTETGIRKLRFNDSSELWNTTLYCKKNHFANAYFRYADQTEQTKRQFVSTLNLLAPGQVHRSITTRNEIAQGNGIVLQRFSQFLNIGGERNVAPPQKFGYDDNAYIYAQLSSPHFTTDYENNTGNFSLVISESNVVNLYGISNVDSLQTIGKDKKPIVIYNVKDFGIFMNLEPTAKQDLIIGEFLLNAVDPEKTLSRSDVVEVIDNFKSFVETKNGEKFLVIDIEDLHFTKQELQLVDVDDNITNVGMIFTMNTQHRTLTIHGILDANAAFTNLIVQSQFTITLRIQVTINGVDKLTVEWTPNSVTDFITLNYDVLFKKITDISLEVIPTTAPAFKSIYSSQLEFLDDPFDLNFNIHVVNVLMYNLYWNPKTSVAEKLEEQYISILKSYTNNDSIILNGVDNQPLSFNTTSYFPDVDSLHAFVQISLANVFTVDTIYDMSPTVPLSMAQNFWLNNTLTFDIQRSTDFPFLIEKCQTHTVSQTLLTNYKISSSRTAVKDGNSLNFEIELLDIFAFKDISEITINVYQTTSSTLINETLVSLRNQK